MIRGPPERDNDDQRSRNELDMAQGLEWAAIAQWIHLCLFQPSSPLAPARIVSVEGEHDHKPT